MAGTVVFDAAHWALHRMLRSHRRVLRVLAWPHSVHHAWLGPDLAIRWELQRRNVWCHLVPEWLTQLAFTGVAALVVPAPVALGCAALQTLVFAGLLAWRGLDVNHRPIAFLDAPPPSVFCLPAYHALHHVRPDAHFSAYGMLVDWVAGSGTALAGRTITLAGAPTAFEAALSGALARRGARIGGRIAGPDDPRLRDVDVLLACDPAVTEVPLVEALASATRRRQLPAEAWIVHERPDDGAARRFHRDARVLHRTIVRPDAAGIAGADAARAARTAIFFLRRGARWIPTAVGWTTWRAYRRFRRATARIPAGTRARGSRATLAAG